MKTEIHKNIFVGDEDSCLKNEIKDLAIVHACKTPCHQRGVDYTGSLDSNHPNYLIFEEEDDLYLNLVDMNSINPKFTNPIFKVAFEFIEKKLKENKKILIHCNLGQSRSSSLGMFYLAKKNIINSESFEKASADFKEKYSSMKLGNGFYDYLKNNWENLISL